MKFVIQDTYSLYKEMLNLPDEERLGFYRNRLMGPFLELFEKMNMPPNPEAIGSFPIVGHDAEMNLMLDKLKNTDALNKAYDQLKPAFKGSNEHMFQFLKYWLLEFSRGIPQFL